MLHVAQSAFLQALGYAITNSLWQMGLLWLVVACINSFVKISSKTKYAIAATAQFAGFVWFIVTMQFYYDHCVAAFENNLQMINSGYTFANDSKTFSLTAINVISKAEQLLPYLSVAYLCLLVFLSIKWIRTYYSTQEIRNNGLQKIDVEWRLFVQKITSHLQIKQEVKIYLSTLIKSPVTIGFLKPIILVPVASINHLTTEQLEAVILHELAHIKRFDYFINIIQSIIELTLFFNPFTQLLSKSIRQERENSCDDWVLQFKYEPATYAEALLRLAYMQAQPTLAMNAAHDKGDLLSRVKRMLNQQQTTFRYKNQLIALLLMTGIFSSVAWLQPDVEQYQHQQKTSVAPHKKIIVEPVVAQTDNPLFNPVFFLSKPIKETVNKAVQQAQASLQQAHIQLDVPKELLADDAAKNEEVKSAMKDGEQLQIDLKNITAPQIKIDSNMLISATKLAFEKGLANVDLNQLKDAVYQAKDEIKKVYSEQNWMQVDDKAIKNQIDESLSQLTKLKTKTFQKQLEALITQAAASTNTTVHVNVQRKVDALNKQLQQEELQLRKEKKKIDIESARVDSSVHAINISTNNAYNNISFAPVRYSYNEAPKINDNAQVVSVTEPDSTANNFCKNISITTKDKQGILHVYTITVELYQ
jgi:beta-lactamase regulating signal transducer with metallopeptidase domain